MAEMEFGGWSKFREEQEMALKPAVQSKQDWLMDSARLLGENLSQRAFGEGGPDLNVTLTDLEQFLEPLVAAVAAGFLGISAGQQGSRLAETLPCPTCGRECSRSDQERSVVAGYGTFTWREPVCHCAHCQRSFFPSTGDPED
jgi:hypothetical protein